MTKINITETRGSQLICPNLITDTNWFSYYLQKITGYNSVRLAREISHLEGLSPEELSRAIGGDFSTLSYLQMTCILPNGSNNQQVADIIREERKKYLLDHPEEEQGRGATDGVIGFDGRFFTLKKWGEMSPSDRFAVVIGSTCSHYNHDVPGYGDNLSEKAKI